MPRSSSKSPDVFGIRPVETSTIEDSSELISPEETSSILTDNPFEFFSTPVTFAPVIKSKPCLFRIFWNSVDSSPSNPGAILSKYSTTVTFDPRRLQTEPSSRPIYPPPIIV